MPYVWKYVKPPDVRRQVLKPPTISWMRCWCWTRTARDGTFAKYHPCFWTRWSAPSRGRLGFWSRKHL